MTIHEPTCAIYRCARCASPIDSEIHYIGTVDSHLAERQSCNCALMYLVRWVPTSEAMPPNKTWVLVTYGVPDANPPMYIAFYRNGDGVPDGTGMEHHRGFFDGGDGRRCLGAPLAWAFVPALPSKVGS